MKVNLTDLDCFVAVAQARNFRKAAAMRGVSASTLSEALRRLEARLDLRLLNRSTRSVTPTAAGQKLLDRLAPALQEVADVLDDIESTRGEFGGTLKLNVPTAVAELILPPLIAEFLEQHPGIAIEITAENTFIDVLAAGFDAGIRYDERVERDMIAIPSGPRMQRFATAASPSYLNRYGTPSHPDDLLKHALIRYRFSSGMLPDWEFAKKGRTRKISGAGPLVANHMPLLVAAAEQGLGVVHTFSGFLDASVKAGRLSYILEDWSDRFTGPFLYFANRQHMPQALRAFVNFIKARRLDS